MSSAPTLNAYPFPQWAAVVSGVAWKAYTLAPDSGAVSVEVMRAPVIVWAKGGGEEAAVKLTTPTLSPLEVRAAAVNAAPHYVRFCQAIGPKGYIFKYWQTPSKVRHYIARPIISALFKGDVPTAFQEIALLKAIRDNLRQSLAKETALLDVLRQLLVCSKADRTALLKGVVVSTIRPIAAQIQQSEAKINKLSRLIRRLSKAILGKLQRLKGNEIFPDTVKAMLFYAQAALKLSLQRAAFRAHLARRIRTPVRRARVRRPLYARPRPPTAPLAPPVI